LASWSGNSSPALLIKQILFLAGMALLALHILVPVCAAQTRQAEDQGQPPPVGAWIQGEPLRFDGSDGKKLYVLVFWATWCDACKDSFAELCRWNSSHDERGVGIVALTSEEESAVRDFLASRRQTMNFRVALDPDNNIANHFQIIEIPKVVILDAKGQSLLTSNMTPDLEKILASASQPDSVNNAIKEELDRVEQMERAESLLLVYSTIARITKEKALLETVHAKIMEYGGGNPEILGLLVQEVLEIREEGTEPYMFEQIMADALVAAERANSLREGKDPSRLADLAGIKNRLGRRQEAISHLRAAVALCRDNEPKKQSLVNTLITHAAAENTHVRWHLECLNGRNAITITLGEGMTLDLESVTIQAANGSGAPMTITQSPPGRKRADTSGNEKPALDGKETYAWFLSGSPEDGPFTIDISYRICKTGGNLCGMPQQLRRIVNLNADQPKGGADTALAHYRGAPVFLGPSAPLLLETRPEESNAPPALLEKEVAEGANFCNHYRLVPVACGEGCLETVLVDLYTGAIISSKVAARELAFSPDSEILVQYSSRSVETPDAPLKIRYTIWGAGEFEEIEDFNKK
jgi:thiol-disulfide isomerase/thioredoxin